MLPVSKEYPISIRYSDPSFPNEKITHQGKMVKNQKWILGRHTGIDFECPVGTPVKSAENGKIITASYDKCVGYFIKIYHEEQKIVSLYYHLSKILDSIKLNSIIDKGQIIGYSGDSGTFCYGPHLHYEERKFPYNLGSDIEPSLVKFD